ncbi:MAG TPA: DUF4157 domain-containing protein [Kofleriaceae bacterium]
MILQIGPAVCVGQGMKDFVLAGAGLAEEVEAKPVPAPGKRTLVQLLADGDDHEPAVTHAAAARGVATARERLPFADSIQRAFGRHDVSMIGAHTGPAAAASARAMGAHAFASGEDIVFGESPDLFTAAHEAAHVVQQRGGVSLTHGVGNEGDPYEQHANAVAALVVRGESAEALLERYASPRGAAPAGAIQRRVVATPKQSQDGATLLAKTVALLDAYTRAQLDWHTAPNISEREHGKVRRVLQWLHKKPELVTACGQMLASDLATALKHTATRTQLLAYARCAAQSEKSIPLEVAPDLSTALRWGAVVQRIEEKLHRAHAGQIFTATQFEAMITDTKVNEVVAYIDQTGGQGPMLHSKNGEEIASMLAFEAEQPLAAFKHQVRYIRNVHRFEPQVLTKLQENWAKPTTEGKQLVVIAQASYDETGAFHREASVSQILNRDDFFALVVEARSSLADVRSAVEQIVTKYGEISQFMFSGHGMSRTMDMAGELKTKDDGTKRQSTKGDLWLGKLRKGTGALLRAVVDAMQPGGRIVFNTCLTDSNDPRPENLDATTLEKLQREMSKRQSLSAYTRTLVGGRKLSVVGANGSFGEGELLDQKTGQLGIQLEHDKHLTNPDKEVYAEKGVDPKGALKALLTVWSTDVDRTVVPRIVRARQQKSKLDWERSVIEALYAVIEQQYLQDIQGAARLVKLAGALDHFAQKHNASAKDAMEAATNADWAIIAPRLALATEFGSEKHIRLLVHQVSTRFGRNEQPFLAAVTPYTARTANDNKLIRVKTLHKYGMLAGLLPPSNNPTYERLVLALLAAREPTTHAVATACVVRRQRRGSRPAPATRGPRTRRARRREVDARHARPREPRPDQQRRRRQLRGSRPAAEPAPRRAAVYARDRTLHDDVRARSPGFDGHLAAVPALAGRQGRDRRDLRGHALHDRTRRPHWLRPDGKRQGEDLERRG